MTPEQIVIRGSLAEFFDKFEPSTDTELWLKLIIEESKELIEAAFAFERDMTSENLLADVLKEGADLIYVLSGFSHLLNWESTDTAPVFASGVDNVIVQRAAEFLDVLKTEVSKDVLMEAFLRVHESNLSKLGDDGKPIRREDGKIMKGPNYRPPVLTDLARTVLASV